MMAVILGNFAPIKTTAYGGACWPHGMLKLRGGHIYLNGFDKIIQYDLDGSHIKTIGPPRPCATYYAFDIVGDQLIFSAGNDLGSGVVDYYAGLRDLSSGDFHLKTDEYFFCFAVQNGVAYGFSKNSLPGRDRHTWISRLNGLETTHQFFRTKSVESPVDQHFFWLVDSQDYTFIVTPLMNKVYIRNRDWGDRLEMRAGGTYPYAWLSLQNYSPPKPFEEKGIFLDSFLLTQHRLAQQFIVFFDKTDSGWVLCYEIPDKNENRVSDTYIGNHLGIQFFDRGLKPTEFYERYGQPVGVVGDQLAVFYPEGFVESKAALYGGVDFSSEAAVLDVTNRRYKVKIRNLTPYVEWLGP
jgi:hypothetical protein